MKMPLFRTRIFLLSVLFLTVAQIKTGAARIYYVNNDSTANDQWCTAVGAGGNSGTNANAPKDTIMGIITAYTLRGGDEVRIDTGSYEEYVQFFESNQGNGSPGSFVTFTGSSNASGTYHAKIDGGGSRTHCFRLQRKKWVKLNNLRMNASTGGDNVFLDYCTNVVVTNCKIYQALAGGQGITISGDSFRNRIVKNYIGDNTDRNQGYGVLLKTHSVSNLIFKNVITNSGFAQVEIEQGSCSNTVMSNKISTGQNRGVAIRKNGGNRCAGNAITGNTICFNSQHGILVDDDADDTLIQGNRIYRNNSGDVDWNGGISVFASSGNCDYVKIINNQIYSNRKFWNICLENTTQYTLKNNAIYQIINPNGGIQANIRMNGAQNGLVQSNAVYNGPRYGFYIENASTGNVIEHNDIYNNGWTGITMGMSGNPNNNIIRNNRIHHNLGSGGNDWEKEGIYYKNSSGTRIIRNMIYKNTGDGIRLDEGSSGSVFMNNTVLSNTIRGIIFNNQATTSCTLRNNLVFGNGNEGVRVVNNPSPYHVHRYNNSYANASANFQYDSSSADATEIQSNANFVSTSPASEYFLYLSPLTSPVINKGDPNDPVPPKGGIRIDIGAVETTNQPSSVNLLSPPAGIWTNAAVFVWNRAAGGQRGIVSNRIEFGTNAGFTGSTLSYITAATLYAPVLPSDMYYWHVRAYDWAGNEGPWGSSRTVNIDTNKPSVSNPVPADGSTLTALAVSFSWTGSDTGGSGITNYGVRIDTDGITNTWEVSLATNAASLAYTFISNGTYHWRVRARDRAGNNGPWSFWTLSIDTNVSIPVLYCPSGVIVTTNRPEYFWSNETDRNALKYWLQIATNTNFAPAAYEASNYNSVTTNMIPGAPLGSDGKFFWRVRSKKAVGWQAWPVIASFLQDTTPPSQVALASPADNAWSSSTFTWNAAADAVSGVKNYKIEISVDSNFTLLAATNTAAGLSYAAPLTNGSYYWRVSALDNAGWRGAWSVVRKMNYDTTAPLFAPAFPALVDLKVNASHTLTWSPAADQGGISRYALIIDGAEQDIGLVTSYAVSFSISGTYQVKIRAYDNAGLFTDSGTITFTVAGTLAPAETRAYPVPCGREKDLTIEYGSGPGKTVNAAGLKVFDLLGRTLLDKSYSTGDADFSPGRIVWDLRNSKGARVMPGVYLFTVRITYADGTSETSDFKKIIVKK